jgi:RNase P subunit RPR2
MRLLSSECMYCEKDVGDTKYGTCDNCEEHWHLVCAKQNADLRQAHDDGIIKDEHHMQFNCPNCGHIMRETESSYF